MERLPESLNEFVSDGSPWQLATKADKTWNVVWSSHVHIGGVSVIYIEAGYTSTTKKSYTAVVNVNVKSLHLENGAEDQGQQRLTVYYRDFNNPEDAKKALESINKRTILHESEGFSPLSTQLYTQTAAPTIGLGI